MTIATRNLLPTTMNFIRRGVFAMRRPVFTAALLLSAVAALPSLSFAHNTASGCGSSASAITLSDENNWKTMCSKTIDLSDGVHDCVATASAQVQNSVSDIHNMYRFTIGTIKNPATGLAWERRMDVNQDVNSADPKEEAISTVRHFNLTAGQYTFYWLARPFDAGADNIDVIGYSLGVVCTDGK